MSLTHEIGFIPPIVILLNHELHLSWSGFRHLSTAFSSNLFGCFSNRVYGGGCFQIYCQ